MTPFYTKTAVRLNCLLTLRTRVFNTEQSVTQQLTCKLPVEILKICLLLAEHQWLESMAYTSVAC